MATPHAPAETRLTLGPDDAGRALTADEFAEADYLEPWRYERADGRLIVMPPDGKGHVFAASPWLERLISHKIQHPGSGPRGRPERLGRPAAGHDRIGDIGVYLGEGEMPGHPE